MELTIFVVLLAIGLSAIFWFLTHVIEFFSGTNEMFRKARKAQKAEEAQKELLK